MLTPSDRTAARSDRRSRLWGTAVGAGTDTRGYAGRLRTATATRFDLGSREGPSRAQPRPPARPRKPGETAASRRPERNSAAGLRERRAPRGESASNLRNSLRAAVPVDRRPRGPEAPGQARRARIENGDRPRQVGGRGGGGRIGARSSQLSREAEHGEEDARIRTMMSATPHRQARSGGGAAPSEESLARSKERPGDDRERLDTKRPPRSEEPLPAWSSPRRARRAEDRGRLAHDDSP